MFFFLLLVGPSWVFFHEAHYKSKVWHMGWSKREHTLILEISLNVFGWFPFLLLSSALLTWSSWVLISTCVHVLGGWTHFHEPNFNNIGSCSHKNMKLFGDVLVVFTFKLLRQLSPLLPLVHVQWCTQQYQTTQQKTIKSISCKGTNKLICVWIL